MTWVKDKIIPIISLKINWEHVLHFLTNKEKRWSEILVWDLTRNDIWLIKDFTHQYNICFYQAYLIHSPYFDSQLYQFVILWYREFKYDKKIKMNNHGWFTPDGEAPQHQMQLKVQRRMSERELLAEILGHNNSSHCQLFPRLFIESSLKA